MTISVSILIPLTIFAVIGVCAVGWLVHSIWSWNKEGM